jgi:DNA-binding NtrC family response regulator
LREISRRERGTLIAIGHHVMTTVLFVSHDPDLRAAATRVLTMAGCRVTAAAHAGHASLACMENAFEVLVIEGRMPDGSGQDLAGRLRRYCPAARVVWMHDAASAPSLEEMAVVRPFTADDLIGAVSDATHYARRGATIR